MAEIDDQGRTKDEASRDIRDVMIEDGSRGRRHPKKVESLQETRRLRGVARLVRRKGYTEEEFTNDLSEFVPNTASPEFRRFLKLWREFHRRFD